MWKETKDCADFLVKQGLKASDIFYVFRDNIPHALNLLTARNKDLLFDVTSKDFCFCSVGSLKPIYFLYKKKTYAQL